MSAIANPASRDLAVLLEKLTSSAVPGGVSVHGLAGHSAEVRAGDLFLAMRGRRFDGMDFLREAAVRGAVAAACEAPGRRNASHDVDIDVDIPLVAVENLTHKAGVIAARFFEHPSAAMQVTAVTGTDGKTSVAYLLAEAAQLQYGAGGFIGTIGRGQFGELAAGGLTTPDALRMQRVLYELRLQGTDRVVLEASSLGLEQGRLEGVDVDIAVFTNLGHDHLDAHGSIENYAAAKEKLFTPGSIEHAVINVDDPFGRRLVDKCRRHCRVTTYSLHAEADVTAHDVSCTASGLRFGILAQGRRFEITSRLLGRFNLLNLLAVFSALLAQGVAPERSASLLGRLSPVRGRMQSIAAHGRRAIVDYAHTPQALEALLKACREITSGKLICVFGCGGERDRAKRPVMGGIASRLAEAVVITDDNPRGEDPRHIADEVLRGVAADAAASVIHDRERAIRRAVSIAGRDDCVIVAGKGHEAFQLVGDERRRFDDAATVRRALEEAP